MRAAGTLGWARPVVVALVVATAAACGLDSTERITGSGERVTDSYDLADFTRLTVENGFEVRMTVGTAGPPELVLTIDDNLLDDVRIGVDDGTLRVRLRDGLSIDVDEPPLVEATVAELSAVRASGASRVEATGIAAAMFDLALSGASSASLAGPIETLTARASGASSLIAPEVAGGEVTAELSGASSAELGGTAALLTVTASGASSVEADALAAERAELDASGASRLEVRAEVAVDAEASGASEIIVAGPAEVGFEASGGSTVRQSD